MIPSASEGTSHDAARGGRFRSNWGRSLNRSDSTNGAHRGIGGGLSSVTGYHLCLVGRRDTGATQYRGGEPAVPCGDAEYVESQRAGGQSVSTEVQVELFARAKPLSGFQANRLARRL